MPELQDAVPPVQQYVADPRPFACPHCSLHTAFQPPKPRDLVFLFFLEGKQSSNTGVTLTWRLCSGIPSQHQSWPRPVAANAPRA